MLSGDGLDEASQQHMFAALFEHVGGAGHVAFDISHAFRHLPLLAAFAVQLMRRTHGLGRVDFYSGVFEARAGDEDAAPVIRLDACSRFLERTEHAAVLLETGNSVPLAADLGLDAREMRFREATNQVGKAHASLAQLRQELEHVKRTGDALDGQSAALLERAWAQVDAAGGNVERNCARARRALEVGDDLVAVTLVFEALVNQVRQHTPGMDRDALRYDNEARDAIVQRLKQCCAGADVMTFHVLRQVRNACTHGTRPSRKQAQQALADRDRFRELINESLTLVSRLPRLLQPAVISQGPRSA